MQIGAVPLWASAFAVDEKDSSILIKARDVLNKVKNKEISTQYDHENFINQEGCSCNCYGFINHLIKEADPEAFEDLLNHMEILGGKGITASFELGQPSPFNFYHIFKNLYEDKLESTHWKGIETISSIIPGDLLVYGPPKFPSLINWNPQSRENMKDGAKSTGSHVMIVSSIVERDPQFVKFKIIDSSFKAHDTNDDTRYILGIQSGIGESTLLIKNSAQQDTYLLKWGSREKNKEYTKEVFAGRLLSLKNSKL